MQKNTAEVILDTAQSIVQEHGFNGFSYAHIAEKVGIRTASIHYYFPNKEDLGEALISRYHKRFISDLAEIDATTPSYLDKLRRYILFYRSASNDEYRICLGVMLSTDLSVLSEKSQHELADYFTTNLEWLERVLEEGRAEGLLRFEGNAAIRAQQFLVSIQGAQILARSFNDVTRFDKITEELISALV